MAETSITASHRLLPERAQIPPSLSVCRSPRIKIPSATRADFSIALVEGRQQWPNLRSYRALLEARSFCQPFALMRTPSPFDKRTHPSERREGFRHQGGYPHAHAIGLRYCQDPQPRGNTRASAISRRRSAGGRRHRGISSPNASAAARPDSAGPSVECPHR
jgi:hypothetical protein